MSSVFVLLHSILVVVESSSASSWSNCPNRRGMSRRQHLEKNLLLTDNKVPGNKSTFIVTRMKWGTKRINPGDGKRLDSLPFPLGGSESTNRYLLPKRSCYINTSWCWQNKKRTFCHFHLMSINKREKKAVACKMFQGVVESAAIDKSIVFIWPGV